MVEDFVQVVQLFASIATIATLVFLVYQVRLQYKATLDQIESTKNQIYTSFVEDCLQVDQMMIQYPECRPYNIEEGDKSLVINISNPILKARVLSMEEMIIDSLENVCTYIDYIPLSQRSTYLDYIESMRKTPAFKHHVEVYAPDYYANSNAVKMDIAAARERIDDEKKALEGRKK